MSSVSVKQNSVSAKNKKQTFMRQSRNRKDINVDNKRFLTEEQLIEKEVITPEDVMLLPEITKRLYFSFIYYN